MGFFDFDNKKKKKDKGLFGTRDSGLFGNKYQPDIFGLVHRENGQDEVEYFVQDVERE